MKPPRFQYGAPSTLQEALELLGRHGPDAKVLAGGQSLMPLLNMRLATPAYLIDINRIAELDYITAKDGYLAIGALARQRQVERSTLVQQRHPLVIETIRHIGHMQIRNRGTITGSIAHADPAAELPALLTCLNGEVVASSAGGQRVIKAGDFFQGYLTTALEPDELVTEVRFPWLPSYAGRDITEFARRSGDYALAGVVVVLVPAPDGRCLSAQISYLGISSTPIRASTVEQLLFGTSLDDNELNAAASAAAQLVDDEMSDIHATADYRRALTMELTRRALQAAWRSCTRTEKGA
ncbi:MAG TPA: xanthine dehydrogenase family protein subunit M [Ktedonobacteraceae bacterium]|nr:xanthine dehydrogenase family protein subunit M [Ktedonobacteraceae bacterium]